MSEFSSEQKVLIVKLQSLMQFPLNISVSSASFSKEGILYLPHFGGAAFLKFMVIFFSPSYKTESLK